MRQGRRRKPTPPIAELRSPSSPLPGPRAIDARGAESRFQEQAEERVKRMSSGGSFQIVAAKRRSVWRELRTVERPHLGRHQSLRPRTKPRQHAVARLRVDEAIAAQSLHMDENVFGALATGEEAEAPGPIEPLDDDDLECADRTRVRARARRRQIRSRGRVGLGDREHPEHLQAAFAPLSLGDDARAFSKGGETVASENGHVDEDVSRAVVRQDEAIAFGGVEPFDSSGDLDQPDRALAAVLYTRRRFQRPYEFIAQFGPHSTRRLHILAASEPLARRDWDHPLGPRQTAEIRNASDSVPKIANRSALNIGNTRNLSVAVDMEKKNPAGRDGRRDHTSARSGAAAQWRLSDCAIRRHPPAPAAASGPQARAANPLRSCDRTERQRRLRSDSAHPD